MASTIKVDNVQNQPGTNIINKCSVTTTIGAGAGETVNVCAATVNIGRCGGTVALACGATQTGFGASGAVSWNTTKITADPANAVSGTGYFCDTSGGAFTVTLPTSPSAGDIVALSDYTRTFNTNNLTIGRNSKPIGGIAEDAALSVDGQSATFVFVDDTEGWINIQETETSQTGATYIVATGGSPCSGAIVCTNYKVHTFTGPGTLCVSAAGNAGGSNTIDYMVVAGGGSGGTAYGGGGGAGGYRESPGTASGCYSVSPRGAAPAVALPVSVQGYPITVGGGGAGVSCSGCNPGVQGADSIFSTITSTGGGAGGGQAPGDGGVGGSGGGATQAKCGGSGNTPATNPVQGMDGGDGGPGAPQYAGGGGGGATVVGTTGHHTPSPAAPAQSGPGGAGATSSINGTPTARAGGGGGGKTSAGAEQGSGGTGGGGGGGQTPGSTSVAGTVNTGGGSGGGFGAPGNSGAGGSGIVIVRYKFQ